MPTPDRQPCPRCGARRAATIVPADARQTGDVVHWDDPTIHCLNCGARWIAEGWRRALLPGGAELTDENLSALISALNGTNGPDR